MRAILVSLLATLAAGSVRQAPEVFLTVTSVEPDGRLVVHRSGVWNGSDHLDSVFVVVGGNRVRPDSLRLLARVGPVVDAGPQREFIDLDASDRRGHWVRIPPKLVAMRVGTIRGLGRSVAAFAPESIVDWADRNDPKRPVVTRVAADVWIAGRRSRAEIEIQIPE